MIDQHDQHAETRTAQTGPNDRRHETNSMDMRAIWLCLLILLLLLVGAQPVISALLRAYTAGEERPLASRLRLFDPGSARHWNNPEADLAALRKREDRHLHEYAWVDRETKRVRMPIERAMELLAQRRGRMHNNLPAGDGHESAEP